MDDAIINYIRKTYNLMIGDRTAETIKVEVGSAGATDGVETLETTAALQRVVPVKPMTDQLLIDLEKAEVVSGDAPKSRPCQDDTDPELPILEFCPHTPCACY